MAKRNYAKTLIWVAKLQWKISKLALAWNVIFSIQNGIVPIISTFALAKLFTAISQISTNKDMSSQVYFWLIVILIVEVITLISLSVDLIVNKRMRYAINIATNEEFIKKMYSLSQEQFDDEKFNTKVDRARDGMFDVFQSTNEIFWAFSAFIQFFGCIASIAIISPLVGAVIASISIPISIVKLKQNKRRENMYETSWKYERLGLHSRMILINPNMMIEVRLMSAMNKLITSWKDNLKRHQDEVFKFEKQSAKAVLITELTRPLAGFGANIYFFQLMLGGVIGLDKFMFLRGILEQAESGAMTAASRFNRLHELSISLRNFYEFFETKPAITDGETIAKTPITIEFRNVSFSYPKNKRRILDDVSFVINPGDKLAIVGENGAGKTTLIKLILRQYLPTSGTILINGIDIKDIRQDRYFSAIGILGQDFTMIKHLTIKDNLTLGLDDNLSNKTIYETTDLVEATSFLKKLPQKLATRLDSSFDSGVDLSGGQKQRLGVARALLRSGDILIMDEPTSAIDAKAEYNIFNNIYKSHAGKTTLIISHRFSTVRKANRIIVMNKGKIVESGTHEELIKNDGLYKEMFELQAEGYR